MSKSILIKVASVGGACAAIGAGAGILGTSAAATSNLPQSNPSTTSTTTAGKHHRRALLARAVHADAIVAVKGGQFVQITLDRGVVQSVSGQQLTIAEGTRKHTYKDVTLTIPSNAKVLDNRQPAQLSSLKSGQIVSVVQGPKHTTVRAHDPKTA